MRIDRKTRIVAGTICLIAASLVMGWFAGRYVPGEPAMPTADAREVLAAGSGRATESVIDFEPGTTMELPALLQGRAHELSDAAQDDLPERAIGSFERMGLWERTTPRLDVTATQVRIASVASFGELNPPYYSWDKTPSDGKMVLVTVSIANASDERYEAWWATLPTFTLWSGLLAADDEMGAGIALDAEAFSLLNPSEGEQDISVDLAPGETQEIVLPFRLVSGALADPSALDDAKASDFALQTSDYAANATYRLWL